MYKCSKNRLELSVGDIIFLDSSCVGDAGLFKISPT